MRQGQPYATWTPEEKARHREACREGAKARRRLRHLAAPKRHCAICEAVLPPGKRGYTCGPACQYERHKRMVSERKLRGTEAEQPMFLPRWCTECDAEFMPKTGIQKLCGRKRCRMANRRRVLNARRARQRAEGGAK